MLIVGHFTQASSPSCAATVPFGIRCDILSFNSEASSRPRFEAQETTTTTLTHEIMAKKSYDPPPLTHLRDDAEWCYDCGGARTCLLCGGHGWDNGQRCFLCGGSGRCIVCGAAGCVPRGTYQDRLDRKVLRPIPGFDPLEPKPDEDEG